MSTHYVEQYSQLGQPDRRVYDIVAVCVSSGPNGEPEAFAIASYNRRDALEALLVAAGRGVDLAMRITETVHFTDIIGWSTDIEYDPDDRPEMAAIQFTTLDPTDGVTPLIWRLEAIRR